LLKLWCHKISSPHKMSWEVSLNYFMKEFVYNWVISSLNVHYYSSVKTYEPIVLICFVLIENTSTTNIISFIAIQ
jgi:hypothetical protein